MQNMELLEEYRSQGKSKYLQARRCCTDVFFPLALFLCLCFSIYSVHKINAVYGQIQELQRDHIAALNKPTIAHQNPNVMSQTDFQNESPSLNSSIIQTLTDTMKELKTDVSKLSIGMDKLTNKTNRFEAAIVHLVNNSFKKREKSLDPSEIRAIKNLTKSTKSKMDSLDDYVKQNYQYIRDELDKLITASEENKQTVNTCSSGSSSGSDIGSGSGSDNGSDNGSGSGSDNGSGRGSGSGSGGCPAKLRKFFTTEQCLETCKVYANTFKCISSKDFENPEFKFTWYHSAVVYVSAKNSQDCGPRCTSIYNFTTRAYVYHPKGSVCECSRHTIAGGSPSDGDIVSILDFAHHQHQNLSVCFRNCQDAAPAPMTTNAPPITKAQITPSAGIKMITGASKHGRCPAKLRQFLTEEQCLGTCHAYANNFTCISSKDLKNITVMFAHDFNNAIHFDVASSQECATKCISEDDFTAKSYAYSRHSCLCSRHTIDHEEAQVPLSFSPEQNFLCFRDCQDDNPAPMTTNAPLMTTAPDTPSAAPHSCAEVQSPPVNPVVTLASGLEVPCDTETHGGGWLVFQRRVDGTVDFNRTWEDYKNGFGDPKGDFWLGLEHLHNITSQGIYKLRVDLKYGRNSYFAEYNIFKILGEEEKYELRVSGYNGNAGDSLKNGIPFSTFDQDNDNTDFRHCAEIFDGGFWFQKQCSNAHLNGLYRWGVYWTEQLFRDNNYKSASFSEMKIKPTNLEN